SLALDTTRDYLYVGNGTSILVFHSASVANGALSTNATIGPSGNTGSMFLDVANDRLYVGHVVINVMVFSPASRASGMSTPRHVAPGSGGNGIMVFSTASTADGAIPPAKTLTITPAPGILKVVVDAVNDRLYAVGSTGHIYLVENVSTLSSGTATAKDAFLSNGGMLTAVAVNPN